MYTQLPAQVIRDVRKDFSAPKMPCVIGVTGAGGVQDGLGHFRQAMAAPAALPEFKGTVAAVETAPFWDEALVAASAKRGHYHRIQDAAYSLQACGRLEHSAQEYPGRKRWVHPLRRSGSGATSRLTFSETKTNSTRAKANVSVTWLFVPDRRTGTCPTSITEGSA